MGPCGASIRLIDLFVINCAVHFLSISWMALLCRHQLAVSVCQESISNWLALIEGLSYYSYGVRAHEQASSAGHRDTLSPFFGTGSDAHLHRISQIRQHFATVCLQLACLSWRATHARSCQISEIWSCHDECFKSFSARARLRPPKSSYCHRFVFKVLFAQTTRHWDASRNKRHQGKVQSAQELATFVRGQSPMNMGAQLETLERPTGWQLGSRADVA